MRKRIMMLFLSGAFGFAGLGLLVAYPNVDSEWGNFLLVMAVLLLELFAVSVFLEWKPWNYFGSRKPSGRPPAYDDEPERLRSPPVDSQ